MGTRFGHDTRLRSRTKGVGGGRSKRHRPRRPSLHSGAEEASRPRPRGESPGPSHPRRGPSPVGGRPRRPRLPSRSSRHLGPHLPLPGWHWADLPSGRDPALWRMLPRRPPPFPSPLWSYPLSFHRGVQPSPTPLQGDGWVPACSGLTDTLRAPSPTPAYRTNPGSNPRTFIGIPKPRCLPASGP